LGLRLLVLAKSIAVLIETLIAILHSLRHRFRSLRCLQTAEGQRWQAGRGNIDRVVRVKNQLDVVGWRRHVVDIQTEKDGENYFHLDSRHPECHDEWMWLIGRALRTSGHTGRKKCL
jgi:hypothetical protein